MSVFGSSTHSSLNKLIELKHHRDHFGLKCAVVVARVAFMKESTRPCKEKYASHVQKREQVQLNKLS